ncbi:hypothetical protein [Microscilla marina]|uniref:Lipoprotein, putative n=1 Tax=Microscilla marina ATCC 23134 TaxID=313606 RepID=A1ZQE9_MICM2|nr:hypothetical protein [Microscilla marina]EAY27321.1 lipoprotein, putative [Microscilla marina ATCC 23134]
MKKTSYIFLSVWCMYLAWAMTGCISKPKFSLSPDIDFDKIEVIRTTDQLGNPSDSISITIKFTDGDGDLGALSNNEGDNFFASIYLRRNGQFVKFEQPSSSLTFNGRFDDLSGGSPGPIQGTLQYSFPGIRVASYTELGIPKNDIWKFQIYIQDRAGNTSDTIFTDSVTVNTD